MWTLQNKTYSNLVDHVLIKGSFMGKTLSFCIQRKKKNLITDEFFFASNLNMSANAKAVSNAYTSLILHNNQVRRDGA